MRYQGLAFSCLLGLTLASAAPAGAATASLVADLAPGPNLPFHLGERLFTLAGKAFFTAEGVLWRSDGTVAGTEPFFDVCAEEGDACQNPASVTILGVAGRSLFFAAGDGLWATDGTRAGTVSLAPPGTLGTSFTLTSKHVFFYACERQECALWKSDGTIPGTVRLGKSGVEDLFAVGDSVFFVHTSLGGGGFPPQEIAELWGSGAADAPPVLLRTFRADNNAITARTAVGARLFFFASEDPAHGYELWTSDGTVAGTRPLTDLPAPFPFLPLLEAVGGKALFVADDTVHGAELWQSDGTPAGTRPITGFASLSPFTTTFSEHAVAQAGSRTLFVADDGLTGPRLWTSGGTPETTVALTGCPGGCPAVQVFVNLWQVGGRVFFLGSDDAHGTELWSTDGTGAGTVRVGDLCPGPCSITALVLQAVSGTAYFRVQAGGGRSVWRSDGTPNGTRRLAILKDDSGFPPPVDLGGRVLFFADGQVWQTDGTPGGTALVTALGYDGDSSDPIFLAPLGNGLLFAADAFPFNRQLFATGGDAATTVSLPATLQDEPPIALGSRSFFLTGTELGSTDGTAAGTAILGPAGPDVLAVFKGRLLFTRGPEFWTSDGTVDGTVRLFGLPANVTHPQFATAVGDRLYFVADSPRSQDAWVSDGTEAGTVRLTNFPFSLPFREHPPGFLRVGGDVYFRADYFSTVLWRTDGTPAGTTSIAGVFPVDLAELGGALLFFSSGSGGTGLYRSDGTAAGTVLLRALAPASRNAGPRFTASGGRLYFTADDGEHGFELWGTDGTAAGTALVADISPGARSSHPSSFAAAGGQLFFAADDGRHGSELWQSDGTAAGTRLVQDLAPGVPSSRPRELTVAGDRLYFSADDGIWGRELWVYPLAAAAPACAPSATALCLSGGRFRVEASWRTAAGFGMGQAVPLSGDTGYFWFFGPGNVEVIVKALDGRALNGHFWTFYGALSNVLYTLTVTDTATGAVRRYLNPAGNLASVADTAAFLPDGSGPRLSLGPTGEPSPLEVRTQVATIVPKAPCAPAPGRLCLAGGRFAVTAAWRDFQGKTGTGTAVALTSDTGYFWFFAPGNVETVLKVLDGRAVNGKFWVFYGALSNVFYTLTVTDTATGIVKTYTNPLGRLASVADVDAF